MIIFFCGKEGDLVVKESLVSCQELAVCPCAICMCLDFQQEASDFPTLFYLFPSLFLKTAATESFTWNSGHLEILKSSARVFLK